MPAPAVTVVVCTRDRPHLLAEALAAVRAAIRPADELVVVDSASADPAAVRAAAGDARLLRCERPGVAVARNAGWQSASHPVVAYTDDDCRPSPGWAEALSATIAERPGAGFAVGPVLADRHTRLPLSVLEPAPPCTWHAGDDPLRIGHTANAAFDRHALASIGGFDEMLGVGGRFAAGEDTDAFGRLLAAGWSGCSCPDAVVVHAQWRPMGAALREVHRYGVGMGAMAVKDARRGAGPLAGLLRALAAEQARRALHDLRTGYQTGALASAIMAVGAVRGGWAARRLQLDDLGRFCP